VTVLKLLQLRIQLSNARMGSGRDLALIAQLRLQLGDSSLSGRKLEVVLAKAGLQLRVAGQRGSSSLMRVSMPE
jgi:hypothetical protein